MIPFRLPDRDLWGKIFAIILPIALQTLLFQVDSIIDATMLGRLSQEALASVTLSNQVQRIYNTLMGTCISGISIFVAQYWGKRDSDTVEKLLGMALQFTFILSAIFFLITFFVPEHTLRIFTDKQIFIDYGSVYLRWISISYFFMALNMSISITCRCTGHVKQLLWISCANVPLDILLNYLFIYKICSSTYSGVDGAAIATVIVRGIGLYLTYREFKREALFRIKWEYCKKAAWSLIRPVLRNTLPILGNFGCYNLGVITGSIIMGHQEADAIAAYSLAVLIINACNILSDGVSGGVSIIIGNILGSGDSENAKRTGQMLFSLSIITGVIAAGLIISAIPYIDLFAKLTPRASFLASCMLLLMLPRAIPKGGNGVLFMTFNTGGDSKSSFYLDLVSVILITIPVGLICAFVLHLHVLILFFIIFMDELIKYPLAIRHYQKYTWVRNLTASKGTAGRH